MPKIGEVLKDAPSVVAEVEAGRLPADGLEPVPVPTGGAIQFEDGLLDPTPSNARG